MLMVQTGKCADVCVCVCLLPFTDKEIKIGDKTGYVMLHEGRRPRPLIKTEKQRWTFSFLGGWGGSLSVLILCASLRSETECACSGAWCRLHVRALSHSAVNHTTWKQHS